MTLPLERLLRRPGPLAGDEAQAQLARHGAAWTDGLPAAAEGCVYRRGFSRRRVS